MDHTNLLYQLIAVLQTLLVLLGQQTDVESTNEPIIANEQIVPETVTETIDDTVVPNQPVTPEVVDEEDQTTIADSETASSLKYFGFAITDCLYDDTTTTKIETDYVAEVKNLSNVIHLCGFDPEQDITDRLQYYKEVNLQALLYVEFVLFDHVSSNKRSKTQAILRPDYKERWRTFARTNKIDSFHNEILALSLVDEPYWNNVSEADLAKVSSFLKTEHPNLKQIVVFAAPTTVKPGVSKVSYPDTIDFIGFDKYATLAPKSDRAYLADLELLESALSEQQQIFIIFESMWRPEYAQYGFPRSKAAEMTQSYFDLAKTHPRVVGLIGYPWPNDFDGSGVVGARGLTELHGLYRSFYNEL